MYSLNRPATKSINVTTSTPLVHDTCDSAEKTSADVPEAESWRPITLRRPFLAALLLVTVILIVVIVLLLVVSGRDQGILFAADINDLPLGRSFCYLYLPTIISVIYGFLWTWLDLDIKRLEPYFQLSKTGGANADNSLSLAYPLEFLITVPFSAFKRRHWNVFAGSVTMMLIFWGLTPTQAGIFAVRTINVNNTVNGMYSTAYTPLSQQGNLTSIYAQSVYNIAWLNETLPPFMTKDYVLGAFGPSDDLERYATNASYTGPTTLYSVDVGCTTAGLFNTTGYMSYNGSQGCDFDAPRYRPNGGNDTSKPFDTLYVGYQNQGGLADYYLSSDCPDEKFFHLFFVRWSKSTTEGIRLADEAGNIDPRLVINDTALFCQASYYQQKVNATIALPSRAVVAASPVSDKVPLPADLFNISSFEWAMASGMEQVPTRGDYPTSDFPSQKSRLLNMPLNLDYIPKMAPFAIATLPRQAEDYLTPDMLRQSYESAYRLLFSRQLVDILGQQLDETTGSEAHIHYVTQAIVVVPVFGYIAISLLAVISLITLGLLVGISRRSNKLRKDPATLGSLMDLVSGDQFTSTAFSAVNGEKSDSLREKLKQQNFQLATSSLGGSSVTRLRKCAPANAHITDLGSDRTTVQLPAKNGIRPTEMKIIIGSVFFIVQVSALVTFLVLFVLARNTSGLALPSQSTFVRQLVQNYIPIIVATLIEPFWIVLNRLLSLLQPFEELRKGTVRTSRAIEVDYASLPPQLLFARAFHARHYVLGTVCMMALLANVLAVALGGIMNERTMSVTIERQLRAPYHNVLSSTINGTGAPLNGVLEDNSDGSMTVEPFYRKVSNVTADTPLPPWADEEAAYLPVDLSGLNQSSTIRFATTSLGAQLSCHSLSTEGSPRYSLDFNDDASMADLVVTFENGTGSAIKCTNYRNWDRSFAESGRNAIRNPYPGHRAVELNSMLTSRNTTSEDDLFCRQHILAGWIRADWRLKAGERMPVSSLAAWPKMDLLSHNATIILCRPDIISHSTEVAVDSDGRILQATHESQTHVLNTDLATNLSLSNLAAQANRYLVDSGSIWHNDSYSSDYNNYLMTKQSSNASRFLDASLPVPDPSEAANDFAAVYKQLFAIFIATNFEYIFVPNSGQSSSVAVKILTPETRIVFSTPAFIVVETILGLYILTTSWFYARRPWRVLPRLTSTIASNIAYFAASRSLVEMSLSGEDGPATRKFWTWSYGTFKGSDGKLHVGIDRDPYVLVPGEDGLPAYSEEDVLDRRRVDWI